MISLKNELQAQLDREKSWEWTTSQMTLMLFEDSLLDSAGIKGQLAPDRLVQRLVQNKFERLDHSLLSKLEIRVYMSMDDPNQVYLPSRALTEPTFQPIQDQIRQLAQKAFNEIDGAEFAGVSAEFEACPKNGAGYAVIELTFLSEILNHKTPSLIK